MTLAVPGATGFVALAQRAVIGIGRVCRPFAVPITERSPEQPSAPKVFRRGRPAGGSAIGQPGPVIVPLRTGLCPVSRLLRLRLASVMRCARLQRVRSRVDTMLANIHPWVPLVGARRSPHYGG